MAPQLYRPLRDLLRCAPGNWAIECTVNVISIAGVSDECIL
jgi:hypothetical protein